LSIDTDQEEREQTEPCPTTAIQSHDDERSSSARDELDRHF